MYLQCTFNVNLSFRLLTLRINLKNTDSAAISQQSYCYRKQLFETVI